MAGTPANEDSTTTTTTVEDNSTTTTTTVADESTTTTTTAVDAGAAERAPVEKQGETVIDKGAKAVTTNDNEQTPAERGDQAKADALRNHEVEHAHDEDENRSTPTEAV